MTQTGSIVFEDPGKKVGRGNANEYELLRDACRLRPGEWAVLKRDAHAGTVGYINLSSLNPRSMWYGFEATSRGSRGVPSSRGNRTIYVRFVGEAK